jgi:type I restriction enzyme S subunit
MLLSNLNLLATAPGGVARLRELILTLAVQGKLVPQDPKDEPASVLLKKIRAEKDQLVAQGKTKRDKPLAGITEDEKPFELPAAWEWARLGAITNYGTTAKAGTLDQTTWVLDMEDIEKSSGRLLQRLRYSERPALSDKNCFSKGDVLYGKLRPYLNKVLVADEDGVCTTEIIPFRCYGDFEPEYFWIMLSSPFFLEYVNARSYGMKMPRLGTDDARNAVVLLPPLAEQSRIVTRVEELMRLCDALEAKGQLEATQHAQLVSTLLGTLTASETPEELADNWQRVATHFDLLLDRPEAVDVLDQTILQLAVQGLLVSHMPVDEPASKLLQRVQLARTAKRRVVQPDSELLNARSDALPAGWSWASIDQVSADTDTAITDGPFGANLKTEHYVDACGFRVIRLQNIGEGSFRKEHHAYIERDRYERLTKHQISRGDIVVAGLVDKSIRCCIVPPDIGPAIVKADCYRFSVHESFSTEYICLYLSSRLAHEFAATHHHGLTLTRIGLGNFRTIPVPVPPAAEQARIVTRVAHLRSLCNDLRQRLAAASERQSQLAQSFVEMQSTTTV